MHKLLIVLVATIVLLADLHLLVGQARRSKHFTSMPQAAREVQERPQLGIDYSDVAKLKLVSRKSLYRINEMISLDLALLNITDKEVFVHKLSGPTITIKAYDETDKEVSVTPSIIALEGVVPRSYSLLGPNEIVTGSIAMLAGCKVEGALAFDEARHKLDEDVRQKRVTYDEAVFERDLFVDWGEVCLRAERPGKYRLVVEVSNRHVILSARQPNAKTAVGIIRSNPLSISISE